MESVQTIEMESLEAKKTSYFPMFILYFILMMEYLRPPFLPPQLTLGFAMILLIFSLMARMQGSVKAIQVKLFFIFNVICVISVVTSVFMNKHVEINITLSRDIYAAVLGYTILFYAMVYVIDSHKKLVHYFVVIIFLMFAVNVLNIQNISQVTRGYLTIGGVFLGDGNDFALALNLVIPLAYYLIGNFNKKIWKLAVTMVLIVFSVSVILTQSRGGILGLVSVFMFISFSSKKRAQMIILSFFAAIVIVLLFGETYLSRMSTLSDYEADSSAMGRINAWNAALSMIGDHPIFGIGLGNFAWAYGLYYHPPDITWMVWRAAHSFFFQILGELGLTGIMCYAGIIISNFLNTRQIFKSKLESSGINFEKLGKSLFAAQLGFLVSGAFLSTAYYPHIFVLSGSIAAAYRIYKSESEKIFIPHHQGVDE